MGFGGDFGAPFGAAAGAPAGASSQFHIYKNDGAGGPVDYTAPVATVSALTYAPAVPADGSDTTYAVRAFDPATGYEEDNTDATARLVLDAAGFDLTARPIAPDRVSARPVAGGLVVTWTAAPVPANPPTAFKVWTTPGGSVDYGSPPYATVGAVPGRLCYTLAVAGLSPGSAWSVAVRATNAAGDEPNTVSVAVAVPASGPAAVDDLAGSAVH